MNITVIGVTKANLMDVITDDSIYVIKKDYCRKDRLTMKSIKDADVNDLLSEDVLIVKITIE
jgi:hypothetical protein